MTLIPRDTITITARQRSDVFPRAVADVKDSILRNGLLNRPVVEREGEQFRLIAGETRLTAIDSIAKDGKSFLCGTDLVEPGFVPVTIFDALTPLARTELEFDENFVRTQPSPQDRIRAMAQIHRLRVAQNPLQTIAQTAKELADKNLPSLSGQMNSPSAIQAELYNAVLVEKHLDNPTIAKARSLKEAVGLVYKMEDDAAQAELIRRRRLHSESHSSVRIEHGDLFEKMKELRANTIDLILSDPPYGINAHRFHKGDRSGEADSHGGAAATNLHAYDDTPEQARRIYLCLLREGFRVTKAQANLVLFIGYKHFDWLVEQSKAMGWVPWERPIIWQKSQSEGLITGWGRKGFIYTYDVIFFATKGQRGLNNPHLDIFQHNKVSRKNRVYSAEKPVALMREWIELCTLPGDMVLDPCAGSGSTLIAARDSKRSALGFEFMQDVVDMATVRLAQTEDEFATTLPAEDENDNG